MASIVRMPSPLANVTEAAISNWLVEEGEEVSVGAPLAEIETEKAVVEYAAEVSGTLGRVLIQAGENVEVGTPIAVVLDPGEGPEAIDPALGGAESSAQTGAGSETEQEEGAKEPSSPGAEPEVTDVPAAPEPETAAPEPDGAAPAPPAAAAAEGAPSPSPAPEGAAGDGPSASGRLAASPIVRWLARERGVDLAQVTGTGPDGRITRRDFERHEQEAPAETPAAPAAASTPAAPPPSSEAAPQAPSGAKTEGAYTDVPVTGMRKAIARRLTESKSTVPHFYVTADCRVDALLELRQTINAQASRKISVNDLVLKAVAGALVEVPDANAAWNGDSIRRFHGVDIAVAVSVDQGLLTPVLRGVDGASITRISAGVAELAERARAGRLQQHELEGGGFAVSNLGMYGVDAFSAILNPPQAGILAVGAAKQRPVVDDGQLAVGSVMTVTLSADHRVIDGAVGAQFMQAFVRRIENPLSILL